MNHRSFLAVAVVAFASVCLMMQPGATGQDKADSPKWEFKAVPFGSDEKESTKKLNDLAADGWDYVGSLGNGMVSFKRRGTRRDAQTEKLYQELVGSLWDYHDKGGNFHVAFGQSGRVLVSPWSGATWTITGPNTIAIKHTKLGEMPIRFDAEFKKWSSKGWGGSEEESTATRLNPEVSPSK